MAKFLSKEQEASIVESISQAEKETSGEVRVHIEKTCPHESPTERAKEVFAELEMHNTEQRNGVIIYVAHKDRKVAIWGDEGIHEKVGQNFWDDELKLLLKYFKAEDYETGLSEVVLKVGHKLKEHFPYQKDDINELPNEISYNDEEAKEPDA
jgi:uncharacterized membrane protein